MGEKQSKSNRRRWSKVPKSKRSEMMRNLVMARHSKLSQRQKNKIGRELTRARLRKAGMAA